MKDSYDVHQGQLFRINRDAGSPAGLSSTPLVAFEHLSSTGPQLKHTLIFLGGLFDGLLTVGYAQPLAKALPANWRLVEPVLSTNYRQWAFSTLNDDVKEIEIFVKFFKTLNPGYDVVLMGHSTGSQMVMHYLLSGGEAAVGTRPQIKGGIMQGGCSDREALGLLCAERDIASACKKADHFVREGRADDILPMNVMKPIFPDTPMTARRWLSIASPGPDHNGEDDYFSSDLSDKRLESTFGRLGEQCIKVCWLFGEKDEYVPDHVDRSAMLDRWHAAARKGGALVDKESGIVEGASHTLKEEGRSLEIVIEKVVSFLERL